MARPNFFIVGAARCGTTSFAQYLSQHPDIFVASEKETHFFAAQEMPLRFGEPMLPGQKRLEDRIIRDESEYLHLFDGVRGEIAVGEASVYYIHYSSVPERIAREVPDARIIVLLRNPVERAYSAYKLLARDERETLAFEQSLDREDERRSLDYEPIWYYTALGRYAQQIERYFAVFGRDRVHVILTEDLEADPNHVLEETFGFLGVRPQVHVDASWRANMGGISRSGGAKLIQELAFGSGIGARVKSLIPATARGRWGERILRATTERQTIPPETRARLKHALDEDTSHLKEVLGNPLTQW